MNPNQPGKFFILVLYGSLLGAITGIASWTFLFLVKESIHFTWQTIPEMLKIESVFYTLFICVLGGALVGLCQKYFGKYPREMDEVIEEYKTAKRVDYRNLHKGVVTGFMVLTFGASLGPEATLVGIIGGLCTWISDKLWIKKEKRIPLVEKSFNAKIKYYFIEPLILLFLPNQSDESSKIEADKRIKKFVYIISAIVGYILFSWLFDLAGLDSFVIKFGDATIMKTEWIAAVPLVIIGIFLGYFYKILGKTLNYFGAKISDYKVIKAIIGGIVLGVFGMILPLTLFSGEHELRELLTDWSTIPAYMLLIIGISKMFVTQFCLRFGWRGGQIYPLIFSGSCIAYALSAWFSIDPVTSVATVVSSMLCTVIKKRVIIAVILCLFFPFDLWLLIGISAMLAAVPDMFKGEFNESKGARVI